MRADRDTKRQTDKEGKERRADRYTKRQTKKAKR